MNAITTPLATLLKRLRPPPPAPAPVSVGHPKPPERRGAPRYPIQRMVWIMQPGSPPAAGTIANVSLSGAAVRISGWNGADSGPWPAALKNGEEISLSGLVAAPVFGWVIAVDKDILRVHFWPDDAARAQLRALIASIAAPRRTV